MTAVAVHELERVAADGWRPLEEEAIGGWRLRAAAGFTQRANSVLPLGEPGVPLGDALDAAGRWYADRGLPLALQVALPGGEALLEHLHHIGARSVGSPVEVMVAPVAPPEVASSIEVALDGTASDAWLSRYLGYRGGAADVDVVRRVLEAGDVALATAGAAVGIGRGVLVDGWLGLSAIEVDAQHRRRGVGTAIVRALAGWASGRGASMAYLQVESTNAPALAAYRGLGFTTHHRYLHVRCPPAP